MTAEHVAFAVLLVTFLASAARIVVVRRRRRRAALSRLDRVLAPYGTRWDKHVDDALRVTRREPR